MRYLAGNFSSPVTVPDREPPQILIGLTATVTTPAALAVRIDDEDRRGRALQLAHPGEVPIEMLELVVKALRVLLRHRREVATLFALVQLIEPIDALLDRHEVGEEATEPALIDEVHTGALCLLRDRLLGLLLGPDEEDRLAAGDRLADRVQGDVEPLDRLGEVDDVDPVALREDEAAHLGIPTTGLVSEVDTGFE